MFLRDISQAYSAADDELTSVLYLRLPPQSGFPPHVLFRVQRGLYGLPESGFLWFRTIHGHHTGKLGMMAAIHDPFFLFTSGMLSANPSSTRGATCSQTDDTLNVGTNAFKLKEQSAVQTFRHKKVEGLPKGKYQVFNCSMVKNNKNSILLNDPLHASRLKEVRHTPGDEATFISQRSHGA